MKFSVCMKVEAIIRWARSCENVSCHIRTTKEQISMRRSACAGVHPRSLNSTFVVCSLDSMTCILAISKFSRFQLGSVAEQAGLNVTWLIIPEDTFSRDVAPLILQSCQNEGVFISWTITH